MLVDTLEKQQTSLFAINANYRLWVYAVLIGITDIKTGKTYYYVKFGDTRQNNEEDARKYAYSETVGKLRGLMGKNIHVLTVADVTDIAISLDPKYDPTLTEENYRKGFDNQMRKFMPGKSGQEVNEYNGSSNELHLMDGEEGTLTYERCEYLWKSAIETYKNGGAEVEKEVYESRPYLDESFVKTEGSQVVYKFLLAAATGAGKETSTLALLIHIHDQKAYDNTKLNVSVATIPSTTSELFNELATVKGMNVGDYGFVDFSRIKPYITAQWYKKYEKDCSEPARDYIRKYATIVKTVAEIPASHDNDVVPVLFGSFHHIAGGKKDAVSGKVKPLRPNYKGLEKRIGTLAIGEAHQMLSNANNKMWKNLNKVFGKKCFKLFITGTPYDFIYGNAAAEFFGVDERALFTRNDLYKDKRANPNSHYLEYPDFNFYGINVKDVVEQLKKDYRWDGDENGFTFNKLFTYDPEKKQFIYEKTILWLFKRMFGMDAFSESGDPLSIYNAPGLCDVAKRHGMIALPVGNDKAGAKDYIPALKNLLVEHGVFPGEVFDAYDDDLGARKDDIANAKGMTLTLTCNKDCTGANIPELGYLVFMRKLGDSVKFFEQATGRVGRKYPGKTNCGVFLADLENSMDIMLQIEQKIASERDENFSVNYLINELLDNYNFFTGKNGEWVNIDTVDFAKTLEELSKKGTYGLNMCANRYNALEGFEYIIKNFQGCENKKLDFNSNGNDGAKNNKKKNLKQLGFDFKDQDTINESWHNMKKNHIARCRKLCFIKDFESLQECVNWVEKSISNNDGEAEQLFGIGFEFIPRYMLDTKQVDVNYTNRWINSLTNVSNVENLFEIMADKALRDNELDFLPTPNRYARRIIERVLRLYQKHNFSKSPTLIDPCAGRGIFLIYAIIIGKELGIDIDPKNVYYNDVDPSWVEVFKKLNKKYMFGIPEKNITCECALKKEYDMNFEDTIVVGNPPYDNYKNSANNVKLWKDFSAKVIGLKPHCIAFVTPNAAFKDVDSNGHAVRELMNSQKYGLVEFRNHGSTVFVGIGVETCHWIISQDSSVSITDAVFSNLNEIEHDICNKVVNYDKKLKLVMENDSLSRDDTNKSKGKYEILFSGNKVEFTDIHVQSGGLKVVMPFSCTYKSMFVTDKPTGMLNMVHYVDDVNEAEDVIKNSKHPLMVFVAAKWKRTSGFTPFVKNGMVPDLKGIDYDDIYDIFDITDDQQQYIKTFLKIK